MDLPFYFHQDFNECDRNPCLNNQTCYDDLDSYFCDCSPSFRGRNCEDEDHCLGETCSYNGFCRETRRRDDFICECFDGYRGRFCEERFECVYLILTLANNTGSLDEVRSVAMSDRMVAIPTREPSNESSQFFEFYQRFNESEPHDRILQFLLNDVDWDEDDTYKTDEGLIIIKGESCLPIEPDQGIVFPVLTESLGYLLRFFEDYLSQFGIERVIVDGDDGCQPNPCQYGGSCYHANDSSRNYFCHCPEGLRGDDCELNIDECDEDDPCENGGNCTDVFGTFNCSCPVGWTGYTCAVESNACKSQPCDNGATCENEGDGFSCECIPGFSGPTCSEEADACNSSSTPCQNNGICINQGTYFTCNCTGSFIGATCDDTSDAENCTETLCAEGGICAFNATTMTRTCVCDPGWTGVYCEESIDDCQNTHACDLDVCNDRGECFDLHQGYSCQCDPGYIGPNCQINVNDCEGVYCRNEGDCVDGENSFYCRCPEGWGGEFCEEDIDECEPMPCQNGGRCFETKIGQFNCTCPAGWEGETCEEVVDPCERENPCRNGGSCNFTGPGNYSCDCIGDFEGANCEIGTYMISGLLVYNFPYDSALQDNSSPEYDNITSRTRSELMEAFVNFGFDYKYCGVTFQDFMEVNNTFAGINVEFCYKAGDRDFSPTLDIGFALSSIQLSLDLLNFTIDVDACQYRGCVNGSTCMSFGDFAYCMCSPGFSGERCENNLCELEICQNGGTCTLSGFNESSTPVRCSCPPEFTGLYCEYITINVQIDANLDGDCAMEPTSFVYWLVNETRGPIVGHGVYGQLNNISIESVSSHNATSATITLDIETYIYPFWVELYESLNSTFDVDLEATILYYTSFLEPPDGVVCSADFVSTRGVEICDREHLPFSGYTPSDRCSGTFECEPPFANDELGCEPQDMVRLGADSCHVLMSPGYPASYAPNQIFTTAFEAPEDHYIEIYIKHDLISLRPGDVILTSDGVFADFENIHPFVINNDTLNSIPPRINTLRGRVFVTFISVWYPDIDLSGNYSWMLQVSVKPVVTTYYEVPPFRYQAVNFPEEKGSYDEDVTSVAIFTTAPGFNLLLCTDFTHTFIDLGDTAVVGNTDDIAFRTIVGVFDPFGDNPPPLPSTIYTLLDTDGSIASPNKNARYSGQVYSIPESSDPSNICPERFRTDCELNPCSEYLPPPTPLTPEQPSFPYTCWLPEERPCASFDADPEEYIFLRNGSMTITSPNYPGTYPANTYMLLTISAVEGNIIGFQYNASDVRLQEGDLILIGRGTSFDRDSIFQVLDKSLLDSRSGRQDVGRSDWNGPFFFLFISSTDGVDKDEMPYSFVIEVRTYT